MININILLTRTNIMSGLTQTTGEMAAYLFKVFTPILLLHGYVQMCKKINATWSSSLTLT